MNTYKKFGRDLKDESDPEEEFDEEDLDYPSEEKLYYREEAEH